MTHDTGPRRCQSSMTEMACLGQTLTASSTRSPRRLVRRLIQYRQIVLVIEQEDVGCDTHAQGVALTLVHVHHHSHGAPHSPGFPGGVRGRRPEGVDQGLTYRATGRRAHAPSPPGSYELDAVSVCGRSVPQVGVGEISLKSDLAAWTIQAQVCGGFFPKLVA